MNDEQLLRYSRHILLPEIDIGGQEALQRARVLIVGLGGLGNPAAQYLAASGVGHLTLADGDKIELSNLQRQILFADDDIGQNKARTACQRIANPCVAVTAIDNFLQDEALGQAIAEVDVVLDCSDNFSTRSAINQHCFTHRKVLVSGAAIGWQGQLAVYDFREANSPCYHCVYRIFGEENLTCSESGVAAPVVGCIGTAQALEAIKVLCGAGQVLTNKLVVFNALTFEWQHFTLQKDPACPVCN